MTHTFRGHLARLVVVAVLGGACATSQSSPAVGSAVPAERIEVLEAGIEALGEALRRGHVTSRALVEQYLARIAAYDQAGPSLNAMITLNAKALEIADALDAARAANQVRGPLHGIPIVVKDNFETVDMPTTGSSVALATLRTERDAFQVARLRRAGAVILGKTNLHELAAGIVTVSSLGGRTRNPYDPTRNPGGSSGGTASAVAASFAAAGMGTDTCGSIRVPAAHNNLVGLRPTMGLSSRAGIIPLSHTQDVAGPIGRSVRDVALLLDATVAPDVSDPVTTMPNIRRPASYVDGLSQDALRGLRFGVAVPLFGDSAADAEVGGIVRAAIARLEGAGATAVDFVVADLTSLMGNTSVIDYEFKFDLMDYLAGRQGAPVSSLGELLDRGLYHADLEPQFRRRNAMAERTSDAYRAALSRRDTLRRALLAAMDAQGVDVVVYPPIRRRAAALGEAQAGGNNCQLSASTGLPALVMPAGFTADGFPVGIELLGRAFDEPRLLAIGAAMEQLGSMRRPPAATPALPVPRPLASRPPQMPAGASRTPEVRAVFNWDAATRILAYDVAVSGVRPADVILVALHRGEATQLGPVIAPLVRTGLTGAKGEVRLRENERDDLLAGRLYVRWYTRMTPLGIGRVPVSVR